MRAPVNEYPALVNQSKTLTREFIGYLLVGELAGITLPKPRYEYRFAPPRRFRFDVCWPEPNRLIALELEGGTWTNGRHSRPAGYAKDCEKYNLATEMGWVILRYTSEMMRSNPLGMIEQIRTVLKMRVRQLREVLQG